MSCSASFISPVVLVCWITPMDEIRFNHYLPYSGNSSYDIVLNVQLPAASIERIIITIMSDDTNTYEIHKVDEAEHVFTELPKSHFIPSSQNTDEMQGVSESSMEKMARNQARKDAKEIKARIDDGDFIRVHWSKVNREADQLAEKALETCYPGLQMPDNHKCDILVEEYKNEYQQSLKERLKDVSVDYFDTEFEAQLRKTAMNDREKEPQNRLYHKRDLAVIRVLSQLEVSLDIADERLVEIHKWADKYEEYYSNSREELIWPDCRGYFRFTR
jgi:hypothetical protein